MTSPLVTTDWLAAHLGDPGVVILDASFFMPGSPRDAREEFTRQHIPGAAFFDIEENSRHDADLPHMLAAPSDFAQAVRRLGVEASSTVVVYDSEGIFSAPRVWWNFRAMGHADVFVLDGGLKAWLAEARPVETGWPAHHHGEFKAHADPALVCDIAGVRAGLAGHTVQIVDARAAGRFRGEAPEPRAGLRSGHMPGALNVPWNAVVGGAGVDLARPIATSCGSGVTAAILALALAQLGRFDVAIYDGSWTEWAGRSDTPVAVGA
jgi:thiosulfate/3-mercaptopyruvate sulfurtransferase